MAAYLPPDPSPLVIVGTLPTTLVETDPLHPISASNTPEAVDFPDTQEGRNAFSAFNRLRAFIHQGFQACDNDPDTPRHLWLRMFSTLLVDFHNSIRVTHSDHPFPAAFTDLNTYKSQHIELINQTFSSFSHFFTNYKSDPQAWDICLCCLEECHIPIDKAEWVSVLKSCAQNIHAAHSTIVNNSIHTLHQEAEAWRLNQTDRLQTDFLSFLTNAEDDVLVVSADPRLKTWIKTTCTCLQTQLRSTLANTTLTKILEPWATTAFDDAKAQKIITLDKLRKELEAATAGEISKAKEAAHIRTAAEAQAFFKQQLDIRTKQSLLDILQHKAELHEAAEVEISAFKHTLKIQTEEHKEKLCTTLAPTPSSSISSQPVARTNKPKKRVDPTARPLPCSRSFSHLHTPSPRVLPPGRSPDMATPRAPPAVELPLTHALTERALSLQPPPTDVSVGPPEGDLELTMMEVHTSQLTAYEYPPAPSALEVQGPSNTVASSLSSLPSQPLPTDPTSEVMATITALSSQVSALSSQFSTHLDCLENPAQLYSPSALAALWQPTLTHIQGPDLPPCQPDPTCNMDEAADFNLGINRQDTSQTQLAHTAQTVAEAELVGTIPPEVRDMWSRLEGLDPCIEHLSPSQFDSLDRFYDFYNQFLTDHYAPTQLPEITGAFEATFISHYRSFLQMRSLACVPKDRTHPTDQLAPSLPANPASGSIQLFPPCGPSQPPTTITNPPPPLPLNKPVDPSVPWTVIGEKKKGQNNPCSFAAAVSSPYQPSEPPLIMTTNRPRDLSEQELQNLTHDQLINAYELRFDCKVTS